LLFDLFYKVAGFLKTILLVQLKIIMQGIFNNADDFRGVLVQQTVRFQSQGIYPPLHNGGKMIVALIVYLFHQFWAEGKLFGWCNLIVTLRIGVYHDQLHYDDVFKQVGRFK